MASHNEIRRSNKRLIRHLHLTDISYKLHSLFIWHIAAIWTLWIRPIIYLKDLGRLTFQPSTYNYVYIILIFQGTDQWSRNGCNVNGRRDVDVRLRTVLIGHRQCLSHLPVGRGRTDYISRMDSIRYFRNLCHLPPLSSRSPVAGRLVPDVSPNLNRDGNRVTPNFMLICIHRFKSIWDSFDCDTSRSERVSCLNMDFRFGFYNLCKLFSLVKMLSKCRGAKF